MVAALLVPGIPLLGALLLGLFGRRLSRAAGMIATTAAGASFLAAMVPFGELLSRSSGRRVVSTVAFDWISVGGLEVPFELRVDPLSMTMVLVVTGVGSLIHAYSIGYMSEDPRRSTYFAYLNLFLFSMLLLVMANNFLVLYMGWELVGACSYLLISFWRERPSAAAAGKKAFLVNRIGDLGLLVGIFLIFNVFGTLDFDRVFESASVSPLTGSVATAIPLLLFVGSCGKSAQIPLHVWLPDAMEGPTPVSALIHAATMVTAGVYLVARSHVLFEGSPLAASVVAVVGVSTALFAATIAVVQTDIKRVLAYSTISQLGYMFLAVGIGALTHSAVAYAAGIFHLVTHAFFKALLFLGAGSVMHSIDGETDMRRMGGLWRSLPITSATFVIGWLAISGIPPLAGFFSKDAILATTWESGRELLWLIALVTAGLTAFYMSRQVFLTFFGERRLEEGVHPHESPPVMTVSLRALALLTLIGGGLGLTLHGGSLARFLSPVFGGLESPEVHSGGGPVLHIPELGLAAIAVVVALAGIALAYRLYLASGAEASRARVAARLQSLLTMARNGYYIDEMYGSFVVWPTRSFAQLLAYGIDLRVIDGVVNGVGGAIVAGATGMRRTQTGFVRRYVMAMLGGTVAILALILARMR